MKLTYLILGLVLMACKESERPSSDQEVTDPTEESPKEDTTTNINYNEMTFLALGDSYTIGEAVREAERWPVLLTDSLKNAGIDLDTRIIAQTGWTTNELRAAIKASDMDPPYDLVSLLIGVNNQYRGYAVDQYSVEFKQLLLMAIEFAGDDSSRVFVVSIPDYGVTHFAENLDRQKIAAEIDQYNQLAESIAGEYGVPFINITPISREAVENGALIADDGLHPSGEMYRYWVELIFPVAKEILDK